MARNEELTPLILKLAEAGCLLDKNAAENLTENHVAHILSLTEKPMMVDSLYLESIGDRKSNAIHISDISSSYEIIKSVDEQDVGKSIQDFIDYFSDRYHQISSFLRQRRPFKRSVSISNIKKGEDVAVIGM